jgi:hypothetical protein
VAWATSNIKHTLFFSLVQLLFLTPKRSSAFLAILGWRFAAVFGVRAGYGAVVFHGEDGAAHHVAVILACDHASTNEDECFRPALSLTHVSAGECAGGQG